MMSVIFVLFLISGHGTLSCSFNLTFSSSLLFEQFLVCQLFNKRPGLAAIGHYW